MNFSSLTSTSKALTRLWSPLPGGYVVPALFTLHNHHSLFTDATASAAAVQNESASASVSSRKRQEEKRGPGWTKWLLFIPGAITFGLGTWQIFRRQDKIKMLDYRQKRLEMDPVRFSDIASYSESLDSLEFRRVLCRGVFDEKRSIYVGPRSRTVSGVSENGYYVVTPLMPIPNDPDSVWSPILVNRGWVPRSWKEKLAEEASQVNEQPSEPTTGSPQRKEKIPWWKFWSKKPNVEEEEVTHIPLVEVVGVVRGSEKPSIFVPENDPSSSQWFYIDVPAISRACGLSPNTIYVEDTNENVNPSCPYPVPKDVNALIRTSVMPQDHLNYTFTWYSLSAAVTFMAFKRIKQHQGRR